MDIQSVQVGFDVATSLSIIGAMITFLWNTKNAKKKEFENTKRKIKSDEISRVINIFANKLEDLLNLKDGLRWGEVGKPKFTNMEVHDIVNSVEIKCNLILLSSFAIWATEEQKKQLQQTQNAVKICLKNLLISLDSGPFKSDHLDDLINQLSNVLSAFSLEVSKI